MERYYTQLIGSQIFTENGTYMGRLGDIVVDPEKGVIVGFLVGMGRNRVFSPHDLVFWNNQLIIRSEEDIGDLDDIVKVRDVLRKDLSLMKKRVVTEKGVFLGQVTDLGFDTQLNTLTKILVAKSFFIFFEIDEKIIARHNILEVKKDVIVVRDPDILVPVDEKKSKLKVRPAPTPNPSVTNQSS